MELTHKSLCEAAVRWLKRPSSRNGPGCSVALAETVNWVNGEIPDAIGWRPSGHRFRGSVLVEVKVSRADFLADSKKPHRKNSGKGMGAYRYYLCPQGLIDVKELPPRWGLVEINARGHMTVKAGHVLAKFSDEDSWRHEFNHDAETCTLVMTLARIGDPQRFQDMIRTLSNEVSRLSRKNQKLSESNHNLAQKILKFQSD